MNGSVPASSGDARSPTGGLRTDESTEAGRLLQLEEIVLSLGRWVARLAFAAELDAPIVSADSIILALRGRVRVGCGARATRQRRSDGSATIAFGIEVADNEI